MFPWTRLITIATACLNITEEKFWKTTPRKFFMLWKDYKIFNGWEKDEEKIVPIDQIF